MTIFHASDSTLILLVSAFLNKSGDEVASMHGETGSNFFPMVKRLHDVSPVGVLVNVKLQ